MAATKGVKFQPNAGKTMADRMSLKFKRDEVVGFDWVAVDQVELLSALMVATQAGVAIMFSAAMGGKGVCIKVFQGEDRAIEYASLPEELSQLLSQVVDAYGSTSEDTRAVVQLGLRAGATS